MKKLLLILLIIGLTVYLFVGCTPTVPTEGEGEGEGEEEVSRVVMVELFSQDGCGGCAVVEPILEQLAEEEYDRSEVILLEERAYGPYSLNEIRDRYSWYLPNSSDRTTPNILFDGFNTTHIHGSSTYVAIKSKIVLELGKVAKIKITAARNSDSSTTTITGTIENISSTSMDNLAINGMAFKNRGEVGLKYSVLDIFAEQKVSIDTFEPGDIKNFSFTLENINWEGNNIHGVIFVQDENSLKKEILQAFYVE